MWEQVTSDGKVDANYSQRTQKAQPPELSLRQRKLYNNWEYWNVGVSFQQPLLQSFGPAQLLSAMDERSQSDSGSFMKLHRNHRPSTTIGVKSST